MKKREKLMHQNDITAIIKLCHDELASAYEQLDEIHSRLDNHHRRIVLLLEHALGIKKDLS